MPPKSRSRKLVFRARPLGVSKRSIPRGPRGYTSQAVALRCVRAAEPITLDVKDGRLYGALEFKLSSVAQYGDFTNLFDQYRIDKVLVTFYPLWTGKDVPNNATNAIVPIMCTATDLDDAGVPASLDYLNAKPEVQYHRTDKPFSVWIKPHVDTEIYRSAVTTGYGNAKNVWIDSLSSDIPHYGLKYAILGDGGFGIGSNGLGIMQIVVKYYVSFRRVH